jgi:hypothetical protein
MLCQSDIRLLQRLLPDQFIEITFKAWPVTSFALLAMSRFASSLRQAHAAIEQRRNYIKNGWISGLLSATHGQAA